MNIGTTIRNQIKAIDPWAFDAWGTKDMMAIEDGLSPTDASVAASYVAAQLAGV